MPCDNASRRGRGMSQPSLRWAPRPSLVTNSPSARGAYVTEDWGRLVHEGHRSFRHHRRELAQLVIADAVTFFNGIYCHEMFLFCLPRAGLGGGSIGVGESRVVLQKGISQHVGFLHRTFAMHSH